MRLIQHILRFASGEFWLTGRANGGDLVFVRSLWTAGTIFFLAIALEERLAPRATWLFDAADLRIAVHDRLEWLGAIFGATYLAYYTRFSSQWAYLAGLYNQLMAAQAQTPPRSHRETDAVYAAWWAGFIEDAEDVHLALKPSYAAVIAGLLGDEQVRAIYVRATINGAQRLAALERRLGARLGTEMFETQTSWRPPSLDWCADHPGADERREQRATVAGQVVALSVRRGGGPGVRVPAISNRVLSAREKRRKERRQARLGYQHLSCTCTQ